MSTKDYRDRVPHATRISCHNDDLPNVTGFAVGAIGDKHFVLEKASRTVNPSSALQRPKSLSSSCRNLPRTCPRTFQNFSEGVEIGRRARLRIPKSSISSVPFRFRKQSIYDGKTRFLTIKGAFTTGG
jgi:hypothetical protein